MQSSTEPNTTSAPSTTTKDIPKNIQPTVSPFQSLFPVQSTKSMPTSIQNIFSLPIEKEKPLIPSASSFPLASKLFSSTSDVVPFKLPLFQVPKPESDAKNPPSTNLFSGQNTDFTTSTTPLFSSEKSLQAAQLFSKSFVEPKPDQSNETISVQTDNNLSASASRSPFQESVREQSSSLPSASSAAQGGLFSKKPPVSLFGKSIQSIQNGASQMSDRNVVKSNHGDKPLRVAKATTTSSKGVSSVSNTSSISPQMDVKHLTEILCKGLHPDDNQRETLWKHFSKFGKVLKITCSLSQNHAIIQFVDHEAAAKAKRNGSLVSTVHNPVSIFWCQKASRTVQGQRLKNDPQIAPPDVNDELQSMLEVGGDHDLLSRPPEKKTKPLVKDRKTKSLPKVSKSSNSKKVVKSAEIPGITAPSTSASVETWTKALTQVAPTPKEKFSVLDSRDKLMRLSLEKQSDLNKAGLLIGTCPDMCPEKERYSRFINKGLALLEQNLNSSELDHKIIVKEYSRSSADQEEPLPHELRPPETLVLTMDYLLCNLMDNTENPQLTFVDWYDFIWNRTRAIRKDITQQNICNITCVEIVEKCARFHIHCSAVLCEEELAIFDPKINNENLTQCLQSLKQLYEDLGQKNVSCPNEPEFRAYDILLNLNKGDMVRRVQTLRKEVRSSPEVRFAVSVAFAFTSYNYVRFFKLLSQASYFCSCILHRYFPEIRIQALKIILKAYCMPNKTEQYPIDNLVHLLRFENSTEAIQFCEMVGLKTAEKSVHLDRLRFSVPISYPICRARSIVESKRTTSLGEAINRKPLPPNPFHQYKPHDSFDENGFLKKEAYQGLDQFITAKVPDASSGIKLTLSAPSSVSTFPEIVVPLQSFIPPQSIIVDSKPFEFSIVDSKPFESKPFEFSCNAPPSVIEQVLSPIVPPVQPPVQPVSNELKVEPSTTDSRAMLTLLFEEISHDVLISILNHVVLEMISDILKDAFVEELQRQKRIKENIIELKSRSLLQELIADVVHNELTDAVRENFVIYWKERLDLMVSNALEMILEKPVSDFVTDIATDVYETEQEQYLAKLEMAREETMLFQVRSIFEKWHKMSLKKQRMEACRNTFPSCPIVQFTTRSHDASGCLSTPLEASVVQNNNTRLLETGILYKTIKEELSWLPLNLSDTFTDAFNDGIEFPQLSPTVKYWKMLLVYFVDDKVDPNCSLISQWVCAKFSKGCEKVKSYAASKVCSLYWLTDLSNHKIAVCVRSIAIVSSTFQDNLSQLKNAALLDGAVAILICFPTVPNFSKDRCQQLEQLLEKRSQIPSIPLFSLMIGSDVEFCDLTSECLANLQQKKLISEYKFCSLNVTNDLYQLSEKVSDAVTWLVQRCPKVPKFTTKYLKDYFQDGIVEVFNIIFQDISHKKNQNVFYQDPEAIISLFNENIKSLFYLVCSPSLNTVSGPPPELAEFGKHSLSWRKPEFWQRLKSIMEACTLPEFTGYPLSREDASVYLQTVAASTDNNASKLISSVNNILRKAVPIGKSEFLISWADVIYECAQFLYSSQIWSKSAEELCAFYLEDEFKSRDLAKRWKEISRSASVLEFCDSYCDGDDEVSTSASKRKLKDVQEPGNETPVVSPSGEKRKKYSEGESDLDRSLKAEREQSDAFSALLQQAMNPFEKSDTNIPSEDFEHHPITSNDYELVPVDPHSSGDYEFSCSGDISQQVAELKRIIESEKRATESLDSTLQALLH